MNQSPYLNNEQQYEYSIRLACENRAVNKMIKRTSYPSKRVEDLIYLLNDLMAFAQVSANVTDNYSRHSNYRLGLAFLEEVKS